MDASAEIEKTSQVKPTEKPDLKSPELWIRTYVQKPFEGFEGKNDPLDETRIFFRGKVASGRFAGKGDAQIQDEFIEDAAGLFDPSKVDAYKKKAEEELAGEAEPLSEEQRAIEQRKVVDAFTDFLGNAVSTASINREFRKDPRFKDRVTTTPEQDLDSLLDKLFNIKSKLTNAGNNRLSQGKPLDEIKENDRPMVDFKYKDYSE